MFLNTKKGKKYVILFITFLLLLSLTPLLQAQEWTCEDAFQLCVALNFSPANPAGFIRCMMGYAFCKDYIEK